MMVQNEHCGVIKQFFVLIIQRSEFIFVRNGWCNNKIKVAVRLFKMNIAWVKTAVFETQNNIEGFAPLGVLHFVYFGVLGVYTYDKVIRIVL